MGFYSGAYLKQAVACAGFVIGTTRNPQIPTFYQRTIARDPSSQWDFHRDIPQVPHHCIYLRYPVLLVTAETSRGRSLRVGISGALYGIIARRTICQGSAHQVSSEIYLVSCLQVVIIEGGNALSPPHTHAIGWFQEGIMLRVDAVLPCKLFDPAAALL